MRDSNNTSGAKNGRYRADVDIDALVSAYMAGESELALSRRFGIARTGIRPRLLAAGVRIRGGSAANHTRFARLTFEQRQALVCHANAQVRGRPARESRLVRAAQTKQRTLSKVGRGEQRLWELMTERGLDPVRERAFERYNIDLALEPVAVEILCSTNARAIETRYRITGRKIEQLRKAGWTVIFVLVRTPEDILPSCLDKIISILEQTRRDPPALGEYWVIRGTGQNATVGDFHID